VKTTSAPSNFVIEIFGIFSTTTHPITPIQIELYSASRKESSNPLFRKIGPVLSIWWRFSSFLGVENLFTSSFPPRLEWGNGFRRLFRPLPTVASRCNLHIISNIFERNNLFSFSSIRPPIAEIQGFLPSTSSYPYSLLPLASTRIVCNTHRTIVGSSNAPL